MKTFKIYRASAGSGKTYQLALRYIALALQSPGNFRHILAVTFTNKATREMKDRIIRFLDQLASGKSGELSKQLESILNYDEKTIRFLAGQTLRDILHHYGHFYVTTIDSFFQSVIRSFSREMGLLGNYEVEMDTNRVLDVLIDKTLEDVGADKDLTRWLIAFAESRVEAGNKWDMRTDIADLAGEIFKEKFKSFEKLIHDDARVRETIREISDNLNDYRKKYEMHVDALARQGLNLMKNAGVTAIQFKYGAQGGPSTFFQKLLNNPAEIPNKRTLDGLSGYEGWISSKNPDEALLIHALDDGLMDALKKVCDYIDAEGARYRGVLQFQHQIFSFGILADLIKRLETYRKENDVLLISDTNYFLKEIISDNETPFIYEKTGAHFRHFLIDEFQDTSGFQWENFKPLVLDSLAQGYENIVVGDGKQSIYRFREGDWDLLNNRITGEISREYQSSVPLNTNYRSACNVVDFNNAAFELLPAILRMQYDGKRDGLHSGQLEHLSQSFMSLYEDVEQNCKKRDSEAPPGYVKIRFASGEGNAEAWKNQMLDDLETQIETLLESGIRPGDIAILVRKKGDGMLVVNRLLSHAMNRSRFGYKVISNESMYLDASWAVRMVIYGIRMIIDPADMLARVGLLYEYLKNREGNSLSDHQIFAMAADKARFEASLPGEFIPQMANLRLQTLLEQAESLIRIFGLNEGEEHTAFLTTLQNALTEYSEDISNITGDFNEWWETTGRQTGVQIPEGIDAIRVVTIHKSKGLEYKAVILPFCNWDLDHPRGNQTILWCHSEDPLFENLERFPLRYSGALNDTIFKEDYVAEYGKSLIDNLNLLYVALTRAEDILIVNARLPKENKSKKDQGIKDVSALLYALFNRSGSGPNPLAGHYDPENHCYQRGDLNGYGDSQKKSEDGTASGPYSSNAWAGKVSIRNKGGVTLDQTFEQRKARISLGIIIHRVLSDIKSAEDMEQQLFLLQQEGVLSQTDLEEVRGQIRQVMKNPAVKPWFDGTYEIKTESPILTNTGSKYQPDRVMLKGNEVVVVDFKTGEASPAHAIQIKKYRKLLQEMGYHVSGAYLLYTKQNKVEEIA